MKVPRYYCPHCRKFKRRTQIRISEYATCYWCAACNEEIVEVSSWILEQVRKHFPVRDVPQGCTSCKYKQAKVEDNDD